MPGTEEYAKLPAEMVTADQVIAWNMRHWRRAAGMTQEEFGRKTGRSAANVSAAERSVSDSRDRRRFDAQAIVSAAVALELPVGALFLPPEDDGHGKRYLFRAGDDGEEEFGMDALMLLVMPGSMSESPQFGLYRQRLEGAATLYLDERWGADIAEWMRGVEGKEARADRAERLRSRRAALLDVAAELESLAAALEEEP